ncbi:MAG: hypothetical protein E6J73_15865 [Deltaproteobacteria bacterium]|nr:MAG: hypothetical protein E6J73_15865 [Deltaproteobacteria bacterium]
MPELGLDLNLAYLGHYPLSKARRRVEHRELSQLFNAIEDSIGFVATKRARQEVHFDAFYPERVKRLFQIV